MKRVLIVLDHYETDMFKVRNKQVEKNFTHSVVGKILKNKIINHPRTGIDTRNCILDIKFLYTKGVPHKNRRTNTYTKPPAKVIHSQAEVLLHHIKETKPDIIISYGAWFADEIVRRYKIDKAKMELIPLDLDGFKTYAFFGPNLKQINLMGSYERDKLLIGNRMVNRFIKGGIENTKPQFGKYKLITDYNEVVHIFKDVLPKYPIIALDFETNTLQTYLKGAKAIMVSLSWKEHQGISIPLSHRLSPNLWTKEQFNSIIEMIKQLMMSDQPKVLHNCMYDIHMMMDIYGLEYAKNCRDTMLMYYETVDERQGAPRGLKHLAYKYTDMGGYEDERDKAFEKYLADDYQHWYDTEMKKYEAGEIKKKPLKSHYVAPTNPVDGSKIDFEWLPMETVYKYAAADTDVTLQLYHTFDKLVQTRPKWPKLCYDFFPKMCDVLAYMQHTGFQIDRNKLEKYRQHFTKDIKDITDKMRDSVPEIAELEKNRLAKIQKREAIKAIKPKDRTAEQKELFKNYGKFIGKDNNGDPKYMFNPGSSKDIGYVLFELMGYELPAEKDYLKPKAVQQRKLSKPETLTWEDYKTDRQTVLPYIAKTYHDDFAKFLLRYSTDKKMLSSTIDGYGKLLDSSGKVHPHFLLHGTVTGRLASRSINAQNIRKPTSNVNDPDYHYGAKNLFVSRFKGGYIFNIDYKSLEFFVASLITKDQGMMQALMDGIDIHKRNASIAFNIPYDEVDPTHRQLAKAVGFGLLYGESPQGLVDSRGLTMEEAQETFKKVLSAMPRMEQVIELTNAFVEQRGYVETISGHVRRLPKAMQNRNPALKSRAIRQAFNCVVQGSGAVCTNTALIYIRKAIHDYHLKSRIAITVHDSIVLDVHPSEVEIVPKLAQNIMQHLPISNFILNMADLPDLKVADKYKINDKQFRFPLFAEMAFGKTYGDDLDFSWDDYDALGKDIEKYYKYSMEVKWIEDKYNTALKDESDDDKKAKIVDEREAKVKEIRDKYFN